MKKRHVVQIILVLLFILFIYSFNQRLLTISPETIRTFIYQAGWLAPLFYIVLYAVRPFVLFPASIFSIAGGLAFGALFGFIFALIGSVAGAFTAFIVARRFGQRAINAKLKGKLEDLSNRFEEKGFMYILVLRLMTIVNFDLISYSAGISKVRLTDFLKATTIGIIPGTIVYNLLGSSIVSGSPVKMASVAILYFLIVIIPLLWRRTIMEKVEKRSESKTG